MYTHVIYCVTGKLGDLRNAWLMVFAITNALWMVLIYTLANQGKLLSVAGSNPIGNHCLVEFLCSF